MPLMNFNANILPKKILIIENDPFLSKIITDNILYDIAFLSPNLFSHINTRICMILTLYVDHYSHTQTHIHTDTHTQTHTQKHAHAHTNKKTFYSRKDMLEEPSKSLSALDYKLPDNLYNKRRTVCLSVCVCVCVYPSSAHSFGPIGMKLGMDLGPLEWHGAGKVALRCSCQRVNFLFEGCLVALLCVSEHLESIEIHFFRKSSWARSAKPEGNEASE